MTRHTRLPLTALALGVALSLSACGGGGGNVRPTQPAPAPAPAPAPSPAPAPDANYSLPTPPPPPAPDRADHGPIASNLQSNLTTNNARGLSLTGQGQIIGIVDTGVDDQTKALQGKVAFSHCYVCDVYGGQTVPGNPSQPLIDPTHADWIGHGTGMATAMVGRSWSSNGIVFDAGIAPDAQLYVGKISFDYGPNAGMNDLDVALAATADLFARGAKVINNSSAGGGWIGSDATTTDYSGYSTYHDGYNSIIRSGGLLVFSAGNDSKNNPAVSSSMPSLFNDKAMEKGWLVVAALDPATGLMASYSNKCGAAQDYCLTANGTVGAGSSDSKDYPRDTGLIWEGTSVAAPAVTATAALVWQAFPWMTNDQVRQTILGTATDLGTAGVDSTYGWGLLNTGHAIRGPGQFAWGDFLATVTSGTSTFGNDILGSGGLVKAGGGTLVLTGNDAYTGATSVGGGTLQIDGTVRSNVTVAPGGRVSGQGIIDANLTNAGGSVLSANKGLNVLGTYTQSSSGDLSVQLGAPLLTKQAVLQGGTLTVVGVAPNYITHAQENVLWAKNGLAGHFDSLKAGTGVMLDATLNYTLNAAYLDITRVSAAGVASAASDGNAHVVQAGQQVEQAFQVADTLSAQSSPLTASQTAFLHSAALVQQAPTLAGAGASIRSLSGESHATTTTLVAQSLDVGADALNRHLAQASGHPSAGWADTFRSGASLYGDGYYGANSQSDGLVAGVDRAVSDQDVVGAAVTSATLNTRLDEVGGRNKVAQVGLSLYARHDAPHWYLQAQLSGGHLDYRIHHNTLLGITSTPNNSRYSGQYEQASVEAGRSIVTTDGTRIVPSLAITGTRIHTGAFTESGTPGFNVVGSAHNLTQWGSRLGVALSHDFSWGAIDYSAAWLHDFSRVAPQIQAHYEGAPLETFTIQGLNLARDRLSVGAGLTANLGHGWEGSFHYDITRLGRDGGRAHTAQLGVRWTF